LVFDLDPINRDGFLATWDGAKDMITNGSPTAFLFHGLISSMT